MPRSKYILAGVKANGKIQITPLVFNEDLSHRDMSRMFDQALILSAGFVNIRAVNETVEVITHGISHGLDLKAREVDADYIRFALGLDDMYNWAQHKQDVALLQQQEVRGQELLELMADSGLA